MSRKAFSLIELVVVMGLIVILAVVSMIAINSLGVVRLDAAVRRMEADIKYAQSLALSMAQWYGVSFEADPGNTYTVYLTDGTTDTVIKDPAATQKDFSINLPDEYDGVIIESVDIGGGSKVEFHPRGYPYTDKNDLLPITATGVVTIEYRGASKAIMIAPNTGRISIQ